MFLTIKFIPKRRNTVVVILLLCSLLASSIQVYIEKDIVFYMMYYRAWELLLGSLLATGFVRSPDKKWLNNGIGIAGIIAISASVGLYDDKMHFPGLSATLPCLGAAAIIHCGRAGPNFFTRTLSSFPFRFMGLISYSPYLWHWPLFVFLKRFSGYISIIDRVWLFVVAVAISTASYGSSSARFAESLMFLVSGRPCT